ncbi:MAG: asparagine synthase (glutamine-hydrolyzing) [Candidatus Thorarchaeota archaeon]
MCGIIGVVSSKEFDLDKFIKMRDTLIHRGPDDEGIYFNKNKSVIFGHRRLSIIDLSPLGKQPMSNEDNSIWITFNGEIYNFQSIKEDLIKSGHSFKSSSDTEVIIHGYEEWGVKILDRLRGMFAFGIWDKNKKELFLARDRLGIKPIYYYCDKEQFIFASEIKAIIQDDTINRKINPNSLKYYLKYTYIPAPHSIWENIYKLPPAHYLILKDNKFKIDKYWEINKSNKNENENNYIKDIEEILKKAVEYRFVSDVPVGILLSGGLDSSMVTAISSEIKDELLSFSIGFEMEEYSELNYAKIVAEKFKTKSIENILDSKKMKEFLDAILFYYDEPLGVSSIFPTFLLMQTVSKYVKVVLSGDGGDEVFAGYTWYYKYLKYRKYNFLSPIYKLLNSLITWIFPKPKNKYIKLFKRKIEFLSLNDFDEYRQLTTPRFEDDEIKRILNIKMSHEFENENVFLEYGKNGLKTIKDLQFLDINTFLSDCILVKVDRASMAHSLEVRVPFLDHFLLGYVMSLHPDIIFKNQELKYLLKQIAKKKLPHDIIYRMKKGFSAPIVKLGFIDDNIHVLSDSIAVKDGIFNQDFINTIDRSNGFYYDAKMWLLILFELWYRKWKS